LFKPLESYDGNKAVLEAGVDDGVHLLKELFRDVVLDPQPEVKLRLS
jgi:hypothetical protein